MANSLLIEKQTGGYFKFTLNGDTANAVTSIQNDLLAVGNQLHFKTGNGANIIKEQFIYPEDVTIVSGGTFTFTTVAQVWDKLIDIDYFAWLGSGGGSGVYIDRFDDLVDTFKYTGNAGKTVVVDNSELKLVPVTLYNKRLFTELDDTPDSLVPNKMVVVNSAGNALILQDQPEAPESLLNSVGYFDYNDLITQTTPLTAVTNTPLKLTNDSEGANTSTDQNPYGVSYVWDSTTNQFNFSELSVGDTIDVRVHVQVTTTTSNQKVDIKAKFGIGSVSQFENAIYENVFKSSGLHEISFVAPFYMGSTYITDYPAELYLTTDASATVKVDGWYVRILRKNINIITVDYQVEDATTTTKGIVRLAGDLSGTANNPTVPELANKVPTSRTIGTTSPLLGGGALISNLTLSIQQSNSVDSGYLSNVDWITFNGKANDNAVVKLTGDQSIAGDKTFTTTNRTTFQNGDAAQITFKNTGDLTKTLNIGYGSNGNIISSTGLDFRVGGLTSSALLIASNENATFKENLTAKSFIKSGGTSSQFLKADGSVDATTYALDSAVVKLTGDQSITGGKSFTTNTVYPTVVVTNNSTGSGLLLQNTSTGRGATSNNVSTGTGFYSDNTSTGTGIYSNNSHTGYGIRSANTSDGTGLYLTNSSSGTGIYSNNSSTGNGIESINSSSGWGISSSNTGSGRGIYSSNNSTGDAINIANSGTGRGIYLTNASSGKSLVLNNDIAATGMPFTISKNGTDKFTINDAGEATAASFIKSGGTSSQFLMADGSVSTGSGGTVTGTGTSGQVAFWNGTSSITGESNLFWDSTNDRLGIGTTSPSTICHLYKASFPILTIQSSSYQSSLGIDTTSGNLVLNNESNAPLSFNTNATERMRITSGGNVLIGTTTDAGYKLDVNGTGRVKGQLTIEANSGSISGARNALYLKNTSSSGNQSNVIVFGSAGTASTWEILNDINANGTTTNQLDFINTGNVRFTIAASGAATFSSTVTASGGFFNSDIRLKDLTDYDYNVSDIKPITYLWKDGRDNKKHVGYSAQEVQKVMPDAVNEDEKGFLSVNYVEVLVAQVELLNNRMAEMQKEIELLKYK